MIAWFASLEVSQKIFAALAIPATVILVIQSIMLFFGFGDHGGDVHVDVHTDTHGDAPSGADGDGVALFTVRGIVAFFTVGGWLGVVLLGNGVGLVLSAILSVIAGALAMYGIAMIMKAALRLQSSGNLELKNAIGLSGRVYIKIPAAGKGVGKVNITLQERYSELEAVTQANRDLLAGEMVNVTGIQSEGVLIVSPFVDEEAPAERRKPKPQTKTEK